MKVDLKSWKYCTNITTEDCKIVIKLRKERYTVVFSSSKIPTFCKNGMGENSNLYFNFWPIYSTVHNGRTGRTVSLACKFK